MLSSHPVAPKCRPPPTPAFQAAPSVPAQPCPALPWSLALSPLPGSAHVAVACFLSTQGSSLPQAPPPTPGLIAHYPSLSHPYSS